MKYYASLSNLHAKQYVLLVYSYFTPYTDSVIPSFDRVILVAVGQTVRYRDWLSPGGWRPRCWSPCPLMPPCIAPSLSHSLGRPLPCALCGISPLARQLSSL